MADIKARYEKIRERNKAIKARLSAKEEEEQLKKGTQEEFEEHGDSLKNILQKVHDNARAGSQSDEPLFDAYEVAEQIAKDHLAEDPYYYIKLAEMEGKGKPAGERAFGDVGHIVEPVKTKGTSSVDLSVDVLAYTKKPTDWNYAVKIHVSGFSPKERKAVASLINIDSNFTEWGNPLLVPSNLKGHLPTEKVYKVSMPNRTFLVDPQGYDYPRYVAELF
jgi:hypothetical protein